MRRLHAQEALNRTIYIEGTNIQQHIKLLHTQKAAVDNLSTSRMSDETWRGIIIRSIPPSTKWLPVIPYLYGMKTAADIVSTLVAHGMVLSQDLTNKATNPSNTALAAQTKEGCTNPNCKAKKKTSHTTPDCYWPGGGKEGQFPPNFGQRTKANIANSTNSTNSTTSTPEKVEHFALSAQILDTPGQSGIMIENDPSPHPHSALYSALISKGFQSFNKGKVPTFMDSAASDTMFVLKEAFKDYKPISNRMGDSAKADNSGFEIPGEGTVIQRYKVDGKEKEITYT